jgi:serine/threonine-protein kinase
VTKQQFERFGKYLLLEKLATGGMAEVCLARAGGANGIAKFFAIKRILPQFAESPEFIEMFKDEAKIAVNLNHSNIVSIHEFGVQEQQFYLVMDYVEGRNLRQILNKMKKSSMQFSIDQISYVIKEVAAGLDHAHRCLDGNTGKPLNITHRDMSPQNVMISFEGEVKIVDFGIAKAESQVENTRAGTLKGKFGYMSPEQAEGQSIDLRTDIFSLGIVLWELLANDRLFSANNELNTLRKIRDCQIPSLRKINPNIHAELERITQKALARDRNLRYQTAAALHRDLSRFLNRQFPDFSPQDFSVFIKSIFSEEIMSTRKRLVDYTKISLNQPVAQQSQSQMSNETQTSSMITQTGPQGFSLSQQSSQAVLAEFPANATVDPLTKVARPDPEQDIDTAASSITRSEVLLDSQVMNQSISQTTPSVPNRTAPRFQRDEQIELEPSMSSFNRTNTRGLRLAESRINISKRDDSSIRATTVFLFFLVTFGIYGYLVKYHTTVMMPVIRITQPYLERVHSALGVSGSVDKASLTAQPNEPAPIVVAPPPNPVQKIAPQAPTNPPASTSPVPITYVVISSQPSGAVILFDGHETGYITPSRVPMPTDQAINLTLRRRGYLDYVRTGLTPASMGIRYTATLQEAEMAFVDIDVVPPKNVRVSINGKQLTESPPFRKLSIPAGIAVKLRVEDGQGSFDETVVNLNKNQRKHIILNLRSYR